MRLHAINSALVEFLTPDLHSFMKQYPLIRLDIEEHPGGAIVRAIAEGAWRLASSRPTRQRLACRCFHTALTSWLSLSRRGTILRASVA
ncbi:hypothetical protein PO002_08770 [Cupriavidus necator]